MRLVFFPANQAYAFVTGIVKDGKLLQPSEMVMVPVDGQTLFNTRDGALSAIAKRGLTVDQTNRVIEKTS